MSRGSASDSEHGAAAFGTLSTVVGGVKHFESGAVKAKMVGS